MSEATSAIEYLLNILFKEKAQRSELKSSVSEMFRSVITEVEIYLLGIQGEDDRNFEKEQKIARLWSQLASKCASYNVEYSDTFLKMSRFWSDPTLVPISEKEEYIQLIRDLLRNSRNDNVCSAG